MALLSTKKAHTHYNFFQFFFQFFSFFRCIASIYYCPTMILTSQLTWKSRRNNSTQTKCAGTDKINFNWKTTWTFLLNFKALKIIDGKSKQQNNRLPNHIRRITTENDNKICYFDNSFKKKTKYSHSSK